MKTMANIAASALLLCAAATASAGTIDPSLEPILENAGANEVVSTLVYLWDQTDLEELTDDLDEINASRWMRHKQVVESLQHLARATQPRLIAQLQALAAEESVFKFHSYWISNCIRVDGTPEAIRSIAAHPDVMWVFYNCEIELVEPTDVGHVEAPGPRTPEDGLVAINAPDVWAMGITGANVLVSTLDTGVDGNHPALSARWAGTLPQYAGHPEWAWFDPVTSTTFPTAFGSHGTHTMGTVCGGAPGDEVGVAPGAHWIHCAVIDRVSIDQTIADALLSFEWMIDPDGNPGTVWDVPQVCSNSWRLTTFHGYPDCDETFWSHLDACEAAGIVILFSAGNEGPGATTIGKPPDRATDEYRTFSVGAVDEHTSGFPIANFSSRGPVYCTPTGEPAIKPEISAPGVNTRSSVPGGGYSTMSGTSMASPHVNGVVALMLEACPNLTVEQIKQIIFDTAVDLGTPGEDNTYGYGMIDALAAVQTALAWCGPTPPYAYNGHFETPVGDPVSVYMTGNDPDGEPDPPGALTYIVVTLPAHGTLSEPGGGDITSVPYAVLDFGNELIYTPNPAFQGEDLFTFKANDGGEPPDGGDSEIADIGITVGVPELIYSYPLDQNPGWTTQGLWAFGQPTGQGGQYGNPDPSSGHTGNLVYGYNLNGDYENELPERHLTSAAIDCSDLTQVQLKFWRWLGVETNVYDHAYIRVSTNGTNWTTVWENGGEITDSSWTYQTVDISAVADNEPTVYVRWTMGTTDFSWRYCGWNIDDVEIWGLVPSSGTCAEDVDGNGVVDILDLLSVLAAWGSTSGPADVNDDGIVDILDLLAVLGAWGPCA